MMQISLKDKIRIFGVHRIPLLATFVLMFLFFIPINSLEFNYFRPNIGMICVFYWAFRRGYMFSYISAFLVGFLIDVYSSSPLGINALMAMSVVLAARYFTRYFQSAAFGLCWGLFAVIGLGELFIKWLVLSIYFGQVLSFSKVLLSYFSTVLCYPFIACLNVWIQNKFLPQERINE